MRTHCVGSALHAGMCCTAINFGRTNEQKVQLRALCLERARRDREVRMWVSSHMYTETENARMDQSLGSIQDTRFYTRAASRKSLFNGSLCTEYTHTRLRPLIANYLGARQHAIDRVYTPSGNAAPRGEHCKRNTLFGQ